MPFRDMEGKKTLTTLVGEPASPAREGSSPMSAAVMTTTSVFLARIFPVRFGILGSLISLTTLSNAGREDSTTSCPPSIARSTTILPSPISLILLTYVSAGISSCAATLGPTCPVSPSVALSPDKSRSNSPSFFTPDERVEAVAHVSAPAKALSERRTPLSHPIAIASLIAYVALGGPMDMIVISVPSVFSFILTASSTAYRSNGFNSASMALLTIVPVFSSIFTLSVDGTCLTSTTILIFLSPLLVFPTQFFCAFPSLHPNTLCARSYWQPNKNLLFS